MPKYTDILVRANLDDDGSLPTCGNVWQSPDIIPHGTTVISPADLTNEANYKCKLGQPVEIGVTNNVYIRGKNVGTSPSKGTVRLFYTEPSVFMPPSSWKEVHTADPDHAPTLLNAAGKDIIAPGEICYSDPAFLLVGPPNGHYCAIAVISTEAHPVKIPESFPTNGAFTSWVEENGAVGWLNFSQVSNSEKTFHYDIHFGSADPSEDDFYFLISASKFAPGTNIVVSCKELNFTKPFTVTTDPQTQMVGFDVTIPAMFSGNLVLEVDAPANFPGGAQLELHYYKVHPFAEILVPQGQSIRAVSKTNSTVFQDDFSLSRMRILGAFTIKITG